MRLYIFLPSFHRICLINTHVCFIKQFILSIFIFCLVNWTYLVFEWVILPFLLSFPLASFIFASQIFTKRQKIIYTVNIYILPCKSRLFAKWVWTKCVILTILLNFPLIFFLLNFGLSNFLQTSEIYYFDQYFIFFIFCLANWTYALCVMKQKAWFDQSFWIFYYF